MLISLEAVLEKTVIVDPSRSSKWRVSVSLFLLFFLARVQSGVPLLESEYGSVLAISTRLILTSVG